MQPSTQASGKFGKWCHSNGSLFIITFEFSWFSVVHMFAVKLSWYEMLSITDVLGVRTPEATNWSKLRGCLDVYKEKLSKTLKMKITYRIEFKALFLW